MKPFLYDSIGEASTKGVLVSGLNFYRKIISGKVNLYIFVPL